MNSLEIKNEFNLNGYIILKEFFSLNEIDSLKIVLKEAIEKIEVESNLNLDGLIFKSNLYRYSKPLQEFVAQLKMDAVVKLLANDDIWVRWDQTITKEPNGKPFPWHRDNAYNKLKARHFQFWIPLTPMTKENGALWVIPKSHKLNKLKHDKIKNHWSVIIDDGFEKEVLVNANVGDAVIFSSFLLHKTETNRSSKNRIAYVIEYMKQNDFDPNIEPPYFFIQNGKPIELAKHPKGNWFQKRYSLIKKGHNDSRWV